MSDDPRDPDRARLNIMRGGNGLLAHAALADLDHLAARFERRSFKRGDVLLEAGRRAPTAYFIERGVASIVKPADGVRTTEIGLIGPEGFAGASIVMADGRSAYRTIVQSDHLQALTIEASALREAFDRSASLRTLLLRAIEEKRVQVSESLVTAVWQQTRARLARWLLMYRDRMRSDRLELTHEFIAVMIGAQRSKTTATLHEIEGEGAIAASRGVIVVRDPAMLEALAQGSYGEHEKRGAFAERFLPAPPAAH